MDRWLNGDLWMVLISIFFGIVFWWNVPGLQMGLFDETGLPPKVIPLHSIANGMEGSGWFLVAILVATQRYRPASCVVSFVSGMWAWDMITTAFLPNMPVPSHYWAWGPMTILAMTVFSGVLWRLHEVST